MKATRLTRHQKNVLTVAAQDGDPVAIQQLLDAHRGFFVYCIRKAFHKPEGRVPVREYLGTLTVKFLHCVKHWRPDMDATISTYSHDALIREVRRQRHQDNHAVEPLTDDEGHRRWYGRHRPSDRRWSGKELLQPKEPHSLFPDWYHWEQLRNDIGRLPQRQRDVLVHVFKDGLTYRQTGKLLHVCGGRAQQIAVKAIKQLQKWAVDYRDRRRIAHLFNGGRWTTKQLLHALFPKPTVVGDPSLVTEELSQS